MYKKTHAVFYMQTCVMETRTEGRRERGRPRKTYMDKIEDIARKTGKGLGEMKRMARNREDWRKNILKLI